MAKDLQRNVKVGDTWFGPAWPENKVTADVRKALEGNDLAFEPVAPADAAGTAFGPRVAGADDDADPGAPIADERAELEKLGKDELFALAEARQVDVKASATKPEIIDALTGKGA